MANPPYQPLDYGRHTKIDKTEAIKLLRSDDTPTISSIPFKPRGGEIYVIKADEKQIKSRQHNQ